MKGLLTKDFCLLMQRKRYFLTIILITLFMAFTMEDTFYINWLMMIFGIFTLSTLSYDEYDNCYPFLMTLPVTAKTYVREKYVFALIMSLFGTIISGVTLLLQTVVLHRSLEFLSAAEYFISGLLILIFIVSLNVPISLKYGSEKGRTIVLFLCGAVFAAGFAIMKLVSSTAVVFVFPALSDAALFTILTAVILPVPLISMFISERIMVKKEF